MKCAFVFLNIPFVLLSLSTPTIFVNESRHSKVGSLRATNPLSCQLGVQVQGVAKLVSPEASALCSWLTPLPSYGTSLRYIPVSANKMDSRDVQFRWL